MNIEKFFGAIFTLIIIALATLLAKLEVVSGSDWTDLAKTIIWAVILGAPLMPMAQAAKAAGESALMKAKSARVYDNGDKV